MVVVTDEKATIRMEHLLQNDSRFNDYALINGQPRGVGGGSILPGDICGHGPLDLLTFAANF